MTRTYNAYCSVAQCSSWAKKNRMLTFHYFPKAEKQYVQINMAGNVERICRQKAWAVKLGIEKHITKNMVVCSRHFTESDYYPRNKVLLHSFILFVLIITLFGS